MGGSPIRVIARSPVAWVTTEEETNLLKLADKAIFWMVSESSGHNASELEVASLKTVPGAELSAVRRRLNRVSHLADATLDPGGVVEVAR